MILKTLKKISFPKIFLLIHCHCHVEPNSHWHSQLNKTRTIIFAKKNSIVKTKVKAKKDLLLTSMP